MGPDSREIDQFDDGRALHMLYLPRMGARLPAHAADQTLHLLSDVLPKLCEGERPVGAQIREWTCAIASSRPIGNAGGRYRRSFTDETGWHIVERVSKTVSRPSQPDPDEFALAFHGSCSFIFRRHPLSSAARIGNEEALAVMGPPSTGFSSRACKRCAATTWCVLVSKRRLGHWLAGLRVPMPLHPPLTNREADDQTCAGGRARPSCVPSCRWSARPCGCWLGEAIALVADVPPPDRLGTRTPIGGADHLCAEARFGAAHGPLHS